jgi:hypothetical protein
MTTLTRIFCTVCKADVVPGHRCPWAEHGPERWERDLRAAGWSEVRLNVWRRPDGALFRGPYGAWCALFSTESAQAADAVDPHVSK